MYDDSVTNLHLTFDYSTYSQKLGDDIAKNCGLLIIYELYFFTFSPEIFLEIVCPGRYVEPQRVVVYFVR